MKHTSLFIVSLICVSIVSPQPVSALSCLDPASSLEYYLEDDQKSIFTATAGETVEHITIPASTDGDPNRQFNEGYVGQHVSVSKVHQGNVETKKWVYFQVNGTWSYMCTNQPPEDGTINLYVVNNPDTAFELPTVVQVFAVDSELAQTLLANLAETENIGYLQETTPESWQRDLERTLREMATLVRIKLAEWVFWMGQ